MRTAYIIGAGEYTGGAPRLAQGDLVICADGGYRTALCLGIPIDLAIGDFDSLGALPSLPPERIRRLPVEKDLTDTEAAILEAEAMGATRLVLLGCTGGRPDHTLAAQQLLVAIAERGKEGYLVGDGFVVTALRRGRVCFSPAASGTISVFAVGGEASGVTIEGLKYCVRDRLLSPAAPLGVSNSFVGGEASVSVSDGTLLLFMEGESVREMKRV